MDLKIAGCNIECKYFLGERIQALENSSYFEKTPLRREQWGNTASAVCNHHHHAQSYIYIYIYIYMHHLLSPQPIHPPPPPPPPQLGLVFGFSLENAVLPLPLPTPFRPQMVFPKVSFQITSFLSYRDSVPTTLEHDSTSLALPS
jgi:hypothetical protein